MWEGQKLLEKKRERIEVHLLSQPKKNIKKLKFIF